MPKPNNISSVEFDKRVVSYFYNKVGKCKQRGIAFNLNLTSVKNMMKAKKCFYTGITLTLPSSDPNATPLLTDFSIDRIDSSLPYQAGNVVACCAWANRFKAGIEGNLGNSSNLLAFQAADKVMKKTIKHLKKTSTETI